ncbi:hypothetical protein HFN60_02050 [Rhizobium leguminosarum]|uniref:hypothetical protein n=1 Tax=Rhizobium leguminosarum TaxID=384 RepID=UPI001C97F294|nr:hypothetical protein [Rhizobium leguminosarum]MBY5814446.1 hypothetical protein [Rhizobium leguminosarum]
MTERLSDADLLAELEDIIRTTPGFSEMNGSDDETFDWLGRVKAIFSDKRLGGHMEANLAIMGLNSSIASWDHQRNLRVLLRSARHKLRMATVGPLSVTVDRGMVFDYYDALKKVVQEARSDLFFIDPYLNSEFLARYLPDVSKSASVRLLGKKGTEGLLQAATLFASQYGLTVEVRRAPEIHDRYVLVDGSQGYHSGASFKDGGLHSPTSLMQVTDTFSAVRETYEKIWANSSSP